MTNGKIQVKTERDIEKNLGIKTETTDSGRNSTSNDPESWHQIKQKLIDKIANLQSENQALLLNLKTKENECVTQINEKNCLEQKFAENSTLQLKEITTMKLDISQLKKEMSAQKSKDEQTISNLNHEIQKLHARIKQFQKGIDQKIHSNGDLDDSDGHIYAVDRLINHKKIKNTMYYLVRWENYSPAHDTWERESNLQCPEILLEYKTAAGLK